MKRSRVITPDLVAFLSGEFLLDWRGIHGAPHWARVHWNGCTLARRNGANARVVELFAFLHDARRENDGHDPWHGARAAELIAELDGKLFCLTRTERLQLETACREHSNGGLRGDLTVRTCWDADRLDLGRVGKHPAPERLCTEEARDPDLIALAFHRSCELRLLHTPRSGWSGACPNA
jgi:uncharacterized protein